MKKLLLIPLCGWLAASTWAATNPAPLTALELLDKFAATQKPLKSFIAQYEGNSQGASSGVLTGRNNTSDAGETRFDGRRVSDWKRLWGQINPQMVRSKDKPYYASVLFDGQWRYQYDQSYWRLEDAPKGGIGTLMLRSVSPSPTNLVELLHLCGSGVALCLGVMPGDVKRVDERLREAAVIQVRDKLELAGVEPSPCYVLEAETPLGHYTVWLDPAHGFQVAKAIFQRQAGHQRFGYTLPAGERELNTVDKVRFAKFGEVWMPVEAAIQRELTDPRLNSSVRGQLKVTKFLLNPDHAALRSFLPDDIRNGAKAYDVGATNAHGGLITYKWQDGQVVDAQGKVHFDSGLKNTKVNTTIPAGKK